MKHMKRQRAPKNWPIERKGTTFVVSGDYKGIPLLIAIRNILKLAKNKKEVKRALLKKEILISNKPAKKEKEMIKFLDTLTIVPSKKNYRLILSKSGKFDLKEIKENEKSRKVSGIIGKKILKGKRTQINLFDGRNFLYEKTCKVNDSALINLEKNYIEKILPLKNEAKIIIVGGKHTGKEGKIKTINKKLKTAEVDVGNEVYNILIKQLTVIE